MQTLCIISEYINFAGKRDFSPSASFFDAFSKVTLICLSFQRFKISLDSQHNPQNGNENEIDGYPLL